MVSAHENYLSRSYLSEPVVCWIRVACNMGSVHDARSKGGYNRGSNHQKHGHGMFHSCCCHRCVGWPADSLGDRRLTFRSGDDLAAGIFFYSHIFCSQWDVHVIINDTPRCKFDENFLFLRCRFLRTPTWIPSVVKITFLIL
jgi:hypothetical protein